MKRTTVILLLIATSSFARNFDESWFSQSVVGLAPDVYTILYDGTTNSEGKAIDLSGNNNTGLVVSTSYLVITNFAGETGGAWKITSYPSYDRILATSNSISTTNDFTIGMWYYTGPTFAAGYMFGIISNNNNYISGYSSPGHGHYIDIIHYTNGALASHLGETNIAIAAPNTWHHFAYVQKDDRGYIYTDGALTTNAIIGKVKTSTSSGLTWGNLRLDGNDYTYSTRFWYYRPYALSYAQSQNSITNMFKQTKPTRIYMP